MTNDELISKLYNSLDEMMEWASELSDEYIDGGDLRGEYRTSLSHAKDALSLAREFLEREKKP